MNKDVLMRVNKKSIFVDIILTLLTAGLWNIWVQMRQIGDTDDLLGEEDHIPSFFLVFVYSIFTLGLYFCYHEYSLTKKLHIMAHGHRIVAIEVFFIFLTLIGLWFIVDSYQQKLLNDIITKRMNEALSRK